MKISHRILLFALIISSVSFAGPFGYKEGRWIFKAKESYFSTHRNFDKQGLTKDLTTDQSLTLFTTTASITYDVSNKISLFSGLDAVYANSNGYDFQRTRFSPTDFKAGSDFLLWSSFVDLIPEFVVTVPILTVDPNTDDAILSEGVLEFRGGSYLSKRFSFLSTYLYLGYAMRNDGRSSLMPYDFQIFKSFKFVQLSAGIWGYESLQDDAKTDIPADRNIVLARVNASSQRFYSVNPSLTEVGGSIGFTLGSEMFTRLGYSHTLTGVNTAYGDTFWLSLSYILGGATKSRFYESKRNQEMGSADFTPETYQEEKVFDEPERTVINTEEDFSTDSQSKAPVTVKLRTAKPDTKSKQKRKLKKRTR